MQFKPESDIIFSYQPNKHLASYLNIKNLSSSSYMFKFKASNPAKISIKPSPHILKPNQQVKVHIAVHREVVPTLNSQQIQILYGVKDYSQTKNFNLLRENGSKEDMLNLTVMVQQKESRVDKLASEIKEYQTYSSSSGSGKKESAKVTYLIVAIIGLLLGYFSPLNLFAP